MELGQKPEEEEFGRSHGGICVKWILTNESAGHSSSVAVLARGRLRKEAGWMFKVRFGNRVNSRPIWATRFAVWKAGQKQHHRDEIQREHKKCVDVNFVFWFCGLS